MGPVERPEKMKGASLSRSAEKSIGERTLRGVMVEDLFGPAKGSGYDTNPCLLVCQIESREKQRKEVFTVLERFEPEMDRIGNAVPKKQLLDYIPGFRGQLGAIIDLFGWRKNKVEKLAILDTERLLGTWSKKEPKENKKTGLTGIDLTNILDGCEPELLESEINWNRILDGCEPLERMMDNILDGCEPLEAMDKIMDGCEPYESELEGKGAPKTIETPNARRSRVEERLREIEEEHGIGQR